MVTIYPAGIDTDLTLKPIVDGKPVSGKSVDQLRIAILAIEEELGVKPSATYGTVRARLDALETGLGNLQIISLAGDLGGTLAHPTVIGIQGRPVSSTAPSPGEVLVWDGVAWEPAPGPSAQVTFGGDLTGNAVTQTVVGIQSRPIASTAPSSGQALVWNGSIWTPTLVAAGASGVRAVASSQPVPSQASEPGWYVIGAFTLSTALNNATVQVVGSVSDPSLTLTVRIFSLTSLAEVVNSRVTITSIPDILALSSPIATLPGNATYQVQAEALSINAPADALWAVVKSVDITT